MLRLSSEGEGGFKSITWMRIRRTSARRISLYSASIATGKPKSVGALTESWMQNQVTLYRQDWIRLVVQSRAQEEAVREAALPESDLKVKIATSVADVYLEHKEYELLAIHYHVLNHPDLRDKYVGLALRKSPTDYMITFLRGIQGRPELIPKQVINRELRRYDKHADWTEKARFLRRVGREREAAESYVAGVLGCLRKGETFAAAFYLKELFATGLTERLFEFAFEEARRDGQLWWQVRALQELGRQSELHSFS